MFESTTPIGATPRINAIDDFVISLNDHTGARKVIKEGNSISTMRGPIVGVGVFVFRRVAKVTATASSIDRSPKFIVGQRLGSHGAGKSYRLLSLFFREAAINRSGS